MKYIDIHGHLNFPEYDSDREATIKRAQDAGVAMVTVGTDLESSKKAVELAEKYENMWAIVGLHPIHTGESEHGHAIPQKFDVEAFTKLAQHSKVVAIGECGLDYFHSKTDDVTLQREIFEQHITVANKVNKPLMLHVRNAKEQKAEEVSAYMESLDILKKSAKVKANFHFFAGTLDDLKAIIDAGYYISCTGAITFAKNYEEIIRTVPFDRLMTETDCPYVAPTPHRGKRNEPSYVTEVVKVIARIRGVEEDIVAEQVMKNAASFFNNFI